MLLRRVGAGAAELDRDEALADHRAAVLPQPRPHDASGLRRLGGHHRRPRRRTGIAACGDTLATVTVDGVVMLCDAGAADAAVPSLGRGDVLALPGFDEYVLGYKDRSMIVDREHMTAIIPGGNGVFRSTIVQAGRVIATWKRTLTAKRVRVDVLPLTSMRKANRRPVEAALQPFAAFHGRELEVRWP